MWFKEYLIKKGDTDLLSSLKALDKKIINKKLKEYNIKNLKELKENIIDEVKICLELSSDDIFSRMYFEKLLNHENSMWMSVYKDDVESLWAFVYETKDGFSYYIADEIKKLIKKTFNL